MIHDINFFTPYQGQKKAQTNKNLYIYSLGGFLGTLIIGTLAWNTVNIMTTDKAIKSYEAKLSAPDIVQAKLEAEHINKKLDILARYNTGLTEIFNGVESREVVSTTLLNKLSSTLPSEVSFNSINITNTDISIQAQSTKRTAIAEVQHNLKQLDNVQDVYIGAISGDDKFSFDLKIQLKDGE